MITLITPTPQVMREQFLISASNFERLLSDNTFDVVGEYLDSFEFPETETPCQTAQRIIKMLNLKVFWTHDLPATVQALAMLLVFFKVRRGRNVKTTRFNEIGFKTLLGVHAAGAIESLTEALTPSFDLSSGRIIPPRQMRDIKVLAGNREAIGHLEDGEFIVLNESSTISVRYPVIVWISLLRRVGTNEYPAWLLNLPDFEQVVISGTRPQGQRASHLRQLESSLLFLFNSIETRWKENTSLQKNQGLIYSVAYMTNVKWAKVTAILKGVGRRIW